MPNRNKYRTIIIKSLFVEELLGFDIYLKHGHNYTLYKPKTSPFSARDKERFENNKVEKLYLKADDFSDFNKYMENNLKQIIFNDQISLESKVKAVYATSINFLDEIYSKSYDIGSENKVDRSYELAKHIMELAMSDKEALNHISTLINGNFCEFAHGVHMASISVSFANYAYNLDKDELVDIALGSILHDIGKTKIDNLILNKPGKLLNEEYEIIKKHPIYGYDMLKSFYTETILNMVKGHHERWCGNGYPTGISGNKISRNALISIICDVYCALVVDRPYRDAMLRSEALLMMEEKMADHFNPELFKKFKTFVKEIWPEDFC